MEKKMKFLKTFSVEKFKEVKGLDLLQTWPDSVHNRVYMSGDTATGDRIFVSISKEIQGTLLNGEKPTCNLKISEVCDEDGVVSFLLHKEGTGALDFTL